VYVLAGPVDLRASSVDVLASRLRGRPGHTRCAGSGLRSRAARPRLFLGGRRDSPVNWAAL